MRCSAECPPIQKSSPRQSPLSNRRRTNSCIHPELSPFLLSFRLKAVLTVRTNTGLRLLPSSSPFLLLIPLLKMNLRHLSSFLVSHGLFYTLFFTTFCSPNCLFIVPPFRSTTHTHTCFHSLSNPPPPSLTHTSLLPRTQTKRTYSGPCPESPWLPRCACCELIAHPGPFSPRVGSSPRCTRRWLYFCSVRAARSCCLCTTWLWRRCSS